MNKQNKLYQFFDLFIIGGLIVVFSIWLNGYLIFDCIDSHIFSIYIIQGIFGTTLPKFGIFSQDISLIVRIQHYPVFSCLIFYIMAIFISKIPVRKKKFFFEHSFLRSFMRYRCVIWILK